MSEQLVRYDAACRALAEAVAIDEVKSFRDKAVAMQAYARQANNRQLEVDAAEIRIRAERRLGEILADSAERGERATRGRQEQTSAPPTLNDLGISRDLSSRAQAIASVPEDEFEATLAEHREQQQAVTGRAMERLAKAAHQVLNTSESNEWYTPQEYIEAARVAMGGIDLDPASCEFANRTVKAKEFYTQEQDGFARVWGGRVWLNPPYGRDDGESNQAKWSARLIEQYRAGNVSAACLLVNAVPGNAWFAPLWEFPICFVSRRIRFYNQDTSAGQPTHSNAIVYLGADTAAFGRAFREIGPVAVRLAID